MGDEAIVVGAGPAGISAAIALRRAGFEPTVFERRTEDDPVGSGLTLWPNAMAALDHLGLAAAVRSVSVPAPGIEIRSANGRLLAAILPEVMERHFGGGGMAMRRADLQDVLTDALGRGCVRLGAGLTSLARSDHGVEARFTDGTVTRAPLLVGADGIQSSVRRYVAGGLPLRYAGYTVWRGVTPYSVGQAYGSLSMGRGAQFGLFPMPAGHVYWFASISVPRQAAGAIGRRGLLDTFAGWHEPVEEVIAATEPREIVMTPIHDADPLRKCARGVVVLVGDAGHPSTPALGQGACQALEDAVVLGRCLRSGRPVADGLREFGRLRVRRTSAMTRQTRRVGAMGQWRNAAACRLRDRMIEYTPACVRMGQLRWMFSFDPAGADRGEVS